MDFKDTIKQLADKFERLKENIQTEEATKNAFVMPFLSALGYDVFNPMEVIPEYTCDIGTKKGEKIDYAIAKDGVPIILMECKHWNQALTLHDNQLLRYFHVSKAKFGILTNGISYKFYTDLEAPNKMDEKPFLEVNILDLKDSHVDELKKFHKSYFDVETIISSASELKYTGALKSIIGNEFQNPSPEFVKLLSKQVYDGVITAKILEQFTGLVKKSISFYVNDIINDRLKSALIATKENDTKFQEEPAAVPEIKESKIVTTEEELEGYVIVKSIIRQVIEAKRIFYRDNQNYFTVIIDDKNNRLICRLYLHSTKKCISFIDDEKKEQKHELKTLDDIFNYSALLLKTAEKFKI